MLGDDFLQFLFYFSFFFQAILGEVNNFMIFKEVFKYFRRFFLSFHFWLNVVFMVCFHSSILVCICPVSALSFLLRKLLHPGFDKV